MLVCQVILVDAEPFSTVLMATVFGTSATIIGLALLVYFKKQTSFLCRG